MTNLTWDDRGKRYFESGLDRGALYFGPKNLGVPWNGLISVDESVSEDEFAITMDGVLQNTIYINTNFQATLTAFTYPDEFAEAQESKFGISYRVFIGNDVSGISKDYQIHLLYNLTASVSDISYESYSDNPKVVTFAWQLSSIPEEIQGFNPTSHVVIDSRFIAADLLQYLEDVLYKGDVASSSVFPASVKPYNDEILDILPAEIQSDEVILSSGTSELLPYDEAAAGPRLPPLSKLLSVVTAFKAILLVPNETTGIATFELGYGDLTATSLTGIYERLPSTRLTISETDGCYFLISE